MRAQQFFLARARVTTENVHPGQDRADFVLCPILAAWCLLVPTTFTGSAQLWDVLPLAFMSRKVHIGREQPVGMRPGRQAGRGATGRTAVGTRAKHGPATSNYVMLTNLARWMITCTIYDFRRLCKTPICAGSANRLCDHGASRHSSS